jgi:hypothetical protein
MQMPGQFSVLNNDDVSEPVCCSGSVVHFGGKTHHRMIRFTERIPRRGQFRITGATAKPDFL